MKNININKPDLGLAKIGVRKWAIDTAIVVEIEPVAALDQLLSAAVLLENKSADITVDTLRDLLDWDCKDADHLLMEKMDRAVEYGMVLVGVNHRYFLDHLAIASYLQDRGIELFQNPAEITGEAA